MPMSSRAVERNLDFRHPDTPIGHVELSVPHHRSLFCPTGRPASELCFVRAVSGKMLNALGGRRQRRVYPPDSNIVILSSGMIEFRYQ